MHGGQIRKRRLYCQRSRPVPKAVFRAGRGGQWVHYFVALVRESIDDNKKTPFKYIQKIKAFKNGSEFIFKPGVNVIVGKNGSGKSTLLNMISKYMLCEKKMCSELPSEALYFPDIFDDDKVLDGISIKSDYIGKVFYLLQQTEMRNREDAKGRRRSVLMTPPVPEKVRVLSPAWYRAAVEFQGRPEQERLAFCSWCCCHGGCNLCMDISKYNIKGLKI